MHTATLLYLVITFTQPAPSWHGSTTVLETPSQSRCKAVAKAHALRTGQRTECHTMVVPAGMKP